MIAIAPKQRYMPSPHLIMSSTETNPCQSYNHYIPWLLAKLADNSVYSVQITSAWSKMKDYVPIAPVLACMLQDE